jgi:hypothetical protein
MRLVNYSLYIISLFLKEEAFLILKSIKIDHNNGNGNIFGIRDLKI